MILKHYSTMSHAKNKYIKMFDFSICVRIVRLNHRGFNLPLA